MKRRWWRRAGEGIALAAMIACRDRSPSTSTPTSTSTSTSTSLSAPRPSGSGRADPLADARGAESAARSLESPTPYIALAIPGYADAVVSVPTGATTPSPVVVVAHGIDDRPEGQCDIWRW